MPAARFRHEDLLRESLLTQLDVAPDGSSVVYGRRTIEDGAYRTRLWRVPLAGGRAEQVTTGDADGRPAAAGRRPPLPGAAVRHRRRDNQGRRAHG